MIINFVIYKKNMIDTHIFLISKNLYLLIIFYNVKFILKEFGLHEKSFKNKDEPKQ